MPFVSFVVGRKSSPYSLSACLTFKSFSPDEHWTHNIYIIDVRIYISSSHVPVSCKSCKQLSDVSHWVNLFFIISLNLSWILYIPCIFNSLSVREILEFMVTSSAKKLKTFFLLISSCFCPCPQQNSQISWCFSTVQSNKLKFDLCNW